MVSEQDYVALLRKAGVPEELHAEAVASLVKSRDLYWKDVIIYKATAFFVMLIAVPQMKWEDNEVPQWAIRWNNNISPHGDANNWPIHPDGYNKREAAPLDKNIRHNAANQPLCYYRKGNPHVRNLMSMFVWMGIRNPGAGRALQVGEDVGGLTRIHETGGVVFDTQRWGDENPGKKNLGIRVLRLGNHWHVMDHYEWKKFTIPLIKKTIRIGLDSSYGYKVGNAGADYDARDPAARICVCHTTLPFFIK